MDLNEVRQIIKNLKLMFTDMVQAGELTQEQANICYPVALDNCLKKQYISSEYAKD